MTMHRDFDLLLLQARAGDQVALGELLKSYDDYLTLMARVQIGRRLRRKVDAADIIQETFLDAHRQFPRFRGTSEPELTSWLRRILAGQLTMMLRRLLGAKARDIRLEEELYGDLNQSSYAAEEGLVAAGSTPSQHASRHEQAVLLADALKQLPPDYREVIILRDLEGLPFADVARRMERSEDSVQKLWVRALTNLRGIVGVER